MHRRFDLNINMQPNQDELDEMFELQKNEKFPNGMNFCNKTYKNLSFKERFLEKTQFRNSFFDKCDLTDVDFCKIDFSGTIFKDCNLSNGMFGMSRFRNASFIGCKLKGANFEFSDLHRATGLYIASYEYGLLIGHFETSREVIHIITADGKNGFYGTLDQLKRSYSAINSLAFLDYFNKVVIDNNS